MAKKKLYNKVNGRELRAAIQASKEARTTLSLYRYFHCPDPAALRDAMYEAFDTQRILGRVYLATEGINAQVSIPTDFLPQFGSLCAQLAPALEGMRLNIAVDDDGKSFFKLTIKVRKKIVADGIHDPNFDVTKTGYYLDAQSFNEKVQSGNAVLVDMRNHYEYEVGHFQNALEIPSETFREQLPMAVDLVQEHKGKHVIMYCTGGIRCEKASAYFRHHGFENVFHLEGGIIKYAHDVREKNLDNLFVGKNFVFDERMGERITPDVIATCHQCNAPCDTHVNCANDACHILFIQCPQCAISYNHCCSSLCKDFLAATPEEQDRQRPHLIFNGTRFAKGRYKAFKAEGGENLK